jgi:hypothetical protein
MPSSDIALIRAWMRLNISHKARLFGSELRGFPIEEFVVDPSVQLIQVHGVDPV